MENALMQQPSHMRYDRLSERHSFDPLGFIQLLYDTTCLKVDLWVKLVWGLGWVLTENLQYVFLLSKS